MSTPTDRPTRRREFIGQLTASAIVLAGGACAKPVVAARPVPLPGTASPPAAGPASLTARTTDWDDSWFGRLTAKHRAVFDSPGIEDGLALANATGYISGMREAVAAGPTDVQTVLVIRHHAIPMAFNDAMWKKYDLGEATEVKDSATNAWATRNPFLAPSARRRGPAPAGNASANANRPQANFTWLVANGHILLGCDRATQGYARTLAKKTGAKTNAVYEELKANLVPGLILQPTGVYAALRAQEAGCAYIKST